MVQHFRDSCQRGQLKFHRKIDGKVARIEGVIIEPLATYLDRGCWHGEAIMLVLEVGKLVLDGQTGFDGPDSRGNTEGFDMTVKAFLKIVEGGSEIVACCRRGDTLGFDHMDEEGDGTKFTEGVWGGSGVKIGGDCGHSGVSEEDGRHKPLKVSEARAIGGNRAGLDGPKLQSLDLREKLLIWVGREGHGFAG